jgi:hypothetical protein
VTDYFDCKLSQAGVWMRKELKFDHVETKSIFRALR